MCCLCISFSKINDYYKYWDVEHIVWQYSGYFVQKNWNWILCAPEQKMLYLTHDRVICWATKLPVSSLSFWPWEESCPNGPGKCPSHRFLLDFSSALEMLRICVCVFVCVLRAIFFIFFLQNRLTTAPEHTLSTGQHLRYLIITKFQSPVSKKSSTGASAFGPRSQVSIFLSQGTLYFYS